MSQSWFLREEEEEEEGALFAGAFEALTGVSSLLEELLASGFFHFGVRGVFPDALSFAVKTWVSAVCEELLVESDIH